MMISHRKEQGKDNGLDRVSGCILANKLRRNHKFNLGVFAQRFPVATFAETLAVYRWFMSVDRGMDDGGRGGHGAASRRRGRRLRVHWRHEQLSIRMAVESALHHSCQRPYRPRIDAGVQTCTWTDISSNKSYEDDAFSSVANLSPTSTGPLATSTTPEFPRNLDPIAPDTIETPQLQMQFINTFKAPKPLKVWGLLPFAMWNLSTRWKWWSSTRVIIHMMDVHPEVAEYVQPAPVVEVVASAPTVTYVAPATVIEYVAPAPAVTNTAPTPVADSVVEETTLSTSSTSTSSATSGVPSATPVLVIEYMAHAPEPSLAELESLQSVIHEKQLEVDRYVRVLKRDTEEFRLLQKSALVPPRDLQELRRKPTRTPSLSQCVNCMHFANNLGYGNADEFRILILRIERLWTVYELATDRRSGIQIPGTADEGAY